MSAASGEREQLLSDVRDAPTVAADLLRYWGIHTEISVAAGLLENFAHHITRLETENAALRAELTNIADAKRFERDPERDPAGNRYFEDDSSFADWAQSRARWTLNHAPQRTSD